MYGLVMTETPADTDAAPPKQRRGPSIVSVAELAGVSPQTVSRVSTGRTHVEPETRERVISAMRELGYRPNRAARALKSGRFRSLGVIVYTLTSHGSTRTVNAVALEAARRGYSLTVIPLASPAPADVLEAFGNLLEQSVDGVVVVVEVQHMDAATVELPRDLPVVVVDAGPRSRYPAIDNDQVTGTRLAVEHLLGLGHATVWHVAGPAHSHSAELRRIVWESTLREAGRTIPPLARGDWSPEAGYVAGLELAARDDVTAVFVANDQMALGLLRAMRDAGKRVPEDVSVVGFDDMPESANFQPPLTTIHQSFDELGIECVSALLEEIETGERKEHAAVPVRFVERLSTARRH